MTQLRQYHAFLTPERKSQTNSLHKSAITTVGTKFTLNYTSPQRKAPQMYGREDQRLAQQPVRSENVSDLEVRVARLRVYLVETAKISKKSINQIFGWDSKAAQTNEDKKLLKQLGAKVQVLLKQNQNLRYPPKRDVEITNECQMFSVREIGNHLYKKLNKSLERTYTTQQFQNNQDIMPNTFIKKQQGISKLITYQPVRRSTVNNSRVSKESPSAGQNQQNFNNELMNIEKVKTLKKYFTIYINTCIEQNDEKFQATQNYVKALENRIIQLEKMKSDIKHLKFEKEVKLQEAMRMTKNVSIAGPNVAGDIDASDSQICQEMQADKAKKETQPVNYFTDKPKLRKITDEQLEQQFISLRQENKLLRQEVASLKKKYQREVESNIRTRANHQIVLKDLQLLNAQNTFLKSELKRKRSPPRNG